MQAPCSLGVVLQAAGIHLPIRFKMLRSMLQDASSRSGSRNVGENVGSAAPGGASALDFTQHGCQVLRLINCAWRQHAGDVSSGFLNGLPCGVACHPWHLFDESSEEGILLGLADVSMSLSLSPNNMSELHQIYIYIYLYLRIYDSRNIMKYLEILYHDRSEVIAHIDFSGEILVSQMWFRPLLARCALER